MYKIINQCTSIFINKQTLYFLFKFLNINIKLFRNISFYCDLININMAENLILCKSAVDQDTKYLHKLQ